MTLIAHRGGWNATEADLAAVPVPDSTESYQAVPYPRLLEEVKLHLPRFGLQIKDEQFALAREGNQMFGVFTCREMIGMGTDSNWALAIGLRSSYDRSLAVELVAGSRVFVCDNLAFSGESKATRKHTANVFRDLPDMIYRMLHGVSVMKERMAGEFSRMEATAMDDPLAHHLMMTAMRRNVIPASRLPKVLEEWLFPRHEAFQPRTAWSLFNAFTEVAKSTSPAQQMDTTLRLSNLFRSTLQLN